MLNVLRRIIEKTSSLNKLSEVVTTIVIELTKALKFDAAAIFLLDVNTKNYILTAQKGFNSNLSLQGQIKLSKDTKLVNLLGRTKKIVNLEQAKFFDDYLYINEANKKKYNAFLGTPIIHQKELLGFIIIREKTIRKFSKDEEALLITISNHLSSIITNNKISNNNLPVHNQENIENTKIDGISGSPGITIGRALILHDTNNIGEIKEKKILKKEIKSEISKFKLAIQKSKTEIQDLTNSLKGILSENEFNLFDAYFKILDEDILMEETINEIKKGNWAKGALKNTIFTHIKKITAIEDEYLQERATDIADLCKRILYHLKDDTVYKRLSTKNTILVGNQVTVSDLALVEHKNLKGIVSCSSSHNSHIAILTRALNIPAVIGINNLNIFLLENKNLILDGYNGDLYISPKRSIIDKFNKRIKEEQKLDLNLNKLNKYKAKTLDNVEFNLLANTNLLTDIKRTKLYNPCGIGLYRSEMPFIISNKIPNENEQLKIYRTLLESFHPKPVTIRILDIGGDKSLPYLHIKEDNPYLGWRGIRIMLDHPEIFIIQIKALLKANHKLNNLQIMLPMISSEEEVLKSINLIQEIYNNIKLTMDSIKLPKIGILLEVPSVIYQLPYIIKKIDFISVGTNDLIQYLFAVDRNNNKVANLYDPLNPSVIIVLNKIAQICKKAGKPFGICGEIATDPLFVILLIAMEYKNLSMNISSINKIKYLIRNIKLSDAKKLLKKILRYNNSIKIKKALILELQKQNLDSLIKQ